MKNKLNSINSDFSVQTFKGGFDNNFSYIITCLRTGYEIIIDWSGWRHISVKYSDILSANNSSGGGVHNPDKLNRVSVLHLADPNSGYAHSAIDYLIFTENEPLRP